MPVLRRIGVLATCRARGGQAAIHEIRDAALVWEDGIIVWAGPRAGMPRAYADLESLDAGGRLVVPGLVDCHTHLAFAGWRADEHERRARGESYLETARSGGGILRTVAATRAADRGALAALCRGRLAAMAALGVTTVEVKSGYDLTFDGELRLLELYGELQATQPVRLVPTLLAAHTVPPEYVEDRSGFVDLVCDRIVPEAARRTLARFCDVFVEESAFTADEGRRILQAGRQHGLRPKLHADQLTDGGGAALAAELDAVSADHLEGVSDAGIARLADSRTVAVSLPLASLYLGRPPMPARRLIDAGVPVAVATDFNPGSAPSFHLPLAMTMACLTQRMTPAEVLKGATCHAARAIGFEAEAGSLEPGRAADFAIIDAPDVNHWLYHFVPNACVATYIGGVRVPQ